METSCTFFRRSRADRYRRGRDDKAGRATRRDEEGAVHAAQRRRSKEMDGRWPARGAGPDPPRELRPARRLDVRRDQLHLGWIADPVQPRSRQDLADIEEPRVPRGLRPHLLPDLAHRARTREDAERPVGGDRAGGALEERGPRRDLAAQSGARRSTVTREVGAGLWRHGPPFDRDRRERSEEDAG